MKMTAKRAENNEMAAKVHVLATEMTAKMQTAKVHVLATKMTAKMQTAKVHVLPTKMTAKMQTAKVHVLPTQNDGESAVCRPERCRQRKSRILGDEKADDTNRLTTQMSVFRQLVRNDKSFIFIAWVSQCLHEFYQDWPVDGKGPFFSVLSFYDHVSVLQGGPSIRLALNMNFHA